MHPDAGALAELVSNWEEVNHLYIVENFLRHLMKKETEGKSHCELTAVLMDNGDISVTLAAVESKYADTCLQASEGIAKLVNNPPPELVNSVLRPMAVGARLVKSESPSTTGEVKDSLDGKTPEESAVVKDISDQLEGNSGASTPKAATLSLLILSAVMATGLLLA